MTESPDLHQPVMTIAHQDMVMLHEDHTVQQALDYIRQQGFGEKIIYFYVVSADGRLKGVILTRRLLTTPLEQRISEVMIKRLITIPHTASVMQAYDLLITSQSSGASCGGSAATDSGRGGCQHIHG
jgi:Mg/Co/Ni transporter MgtE